MKLNEIFPPDGVKRRRLTGLVYLGQYLSP
jgi:hypothetical protein